MFQRLQAIREEREGGFTLIELLVVVIIIAILAAIAIPVFLNQREKGWEAQAESAAKNAGTAMETHGVDNNGSYTFEGTEDSDKTLADAGFNDTDDVTTTAFVSSDGLAFCIVANHASLDDDVFYHSDAGAPTDVRPAAPCPAAAP